MYCYSNWHYLDTLCNTHCSVMFLSKEILSSLVLFSTTNGFYYRKKSQAERSCEIIFVIDFCMNFYPTVLETS